MSGIGKDPQLRAGSPAMHVATDVPALAPFEVWVTPHLEVMLRAAARLTGGNWAEAEDLVQDALLRAFRAQDSFDGAHPRAWLLTILRRTHLNELRRQRPRLVDDAHLERSRPAFGARGDVPSAEQTVVDTLLGPELQTALADLDPRFRVVVLLIDVDQLTYAETAELLGVPEGTVMSRLSRGRRRLRTQLSDTLDRKGASPTGSHGKGGAT